MKFKAVAAVTLKKALPAVVGLAVLVLVIAWLAGAFTKKIPPGQAAVAGPPAVPATTPSGRLPVGQDQQRQVDGLFSSSPTRPIVRRSERWVALHLRDERLPPDPVDVEFCLWHVR